MAMLPLLMQTLQSLKKINFWEELLFMGLIYIFLKDNMDLVYLIFFMMEIYNSINKLNQIVENYKIL